MSFSDFASEVACFRMIFLMLSGPHALFVFRVCRHLVIFSSSVIVMQFISD